MTSKYKFFQQILSALLCAVLLLILLPTTAYAMVVGFKIIPASPVYSVGESVNIKLDGGFIFTGSDMQNNAAIGGYFVDAGDPLPAGLTLDGSTPDVIGSGAGYRDRYITGTATTPGTYNITISINAQTAGKLSQSFTLKILALESAITPPTIDYVNEKLTGLASGDYSFAGQNGTTATVNGDHAIDSTWFGTTLSIVKKGDHATVGDSTPLTFSIPARPDAPSVTGVNETIAGQNDGKITGTTTAMEWSGNAGTSWDDCTGTEITGLAPGDYLVRVKAVAATSFASDQVPITIATGAVQTRALAVTAPTFDSATAGYTRPAAKAITIANGGNSGVAISGVTLTGANANAFEIGGSGANVAAGGSITTWTVQPKAGLAAGSYTATIKVANDGDPNPSTAQVSFTVTDTRSLTVTAPTFDNVTAGYTRPAAKAITITNGGTGATTINSVTLSGANADAFEIGGSGANVAAGGSIDTWTVQPKAGLAAGSYTATIEVANDGDPNPSTAQVSFSVTAADHSPQNPPGKDTPVNTAKDLTVTFNGEWANVADIRLNGIPLARAATSTTRANLSSYLNYSAILGIAESGSVKVTLYKEFLQWLPNGEYKLEVEFNDGGVVSSGAAEFLIKNETTSTPPVSSASPATTSGSPQTGDRSNMGLWVTLLVVSLATLGAGVWLLARRKSRKQN